MAGVDTGRPLEPGSIIGPTFDARTVISSNKGMLEHCILSDVTFIVGENKTSIRVGDS